MRVRRQGHIGVVALLLAVSAPAAGKPPETGWSFALVPYVWMAGSDMRLRHPGFPLAVETSTSFGEILRNLDFGAMVAFEGRHGRWGFLVDGLYVKISDAATVEVPQLGGAPLSAEAGLRTFTGLAAVQYRAVEDQTGSLDLVAGPRLWSLRTRITAALPPEAPLPPEVPTSYDRSETLDWVDAMAGARAMVRLAPGITLNAHAMFGAGGSRFSSDSLLALGVSVGRHVSLQAGYRHQSADVRRASGLAVDTQLHGPVLGARIRF